MPFVERASLKRVHIEPHGHTPHLARGLLRLCKERSPVALATQGLIDREPLPCEIPNESGTDAIDILSTRRKKVREQYLIRVIGVRIFARLPPNHRQHDVRQMPRIVQQLLMRDHKRRITFVVPAGVEIAIVLREER